MNLRLTHRHVHPAVNLAVIAAILAVLTTACGESTPTRAAAPATSTTNSPDASDAPVIDPGDPSDHPPLPDATEFVAVVDNPYLPFAPGTTWVYEGTSEGETERIEIEVLAERKEIQGISATIVRDTVYVGGELVEDTFDWFAQDRDGNVWYLGEDVKDYERGEVVSTAGSFEAGSDGALAGIVMPTEPRVGHAFRQELYPGEAEDMAEILQVDARSTVAAGTYDDVVVTRDWNPLDPHPIEEKHYARGVGLIFETHTRGPAGSVELLEFTPGA
ncbi:hypothetical protein BH20ACT2_BH20ACT2_17830 [soil metagenome]